MNGKGRAALKAIGLALDVMEVGPVASERQLFRPDAERRHPSGAALERARRLLSQEHDVAVKIARRFIGD